MSSSYLTIIGSVGGVVMLKCKELKAEKNLIKCYHLDFRLRIQSCQWEETTIDRKLAKP